MSLVIRLSRTGKRGERKFRIVVKEKRSSREGKPVEILGWYEKRINGENKKIDKERINYWISQGAIPSDTVSKLIK